MAENRTINLKVNTEAQDVQKQFGDLREKIKQSKENLDELNKSFGENSKEVREAQTNLNSLEGAYQNLSKSNTDLGASFEDINGEIKPLTAQMGEMEDRLYQMALAGDTASQEYRDLLAEVGKYRKIQIDTDLATDAAASTLSQNLGGALQGAASGFAVVQGAMGLFGTESEEVQEALLKVQSAMAIADGFRGIQEGTKAIKAMTSATNLQAIATKAQSAATYVQATAQKALNLAMAANPIGLIIVAVTTVIGLFAAWFAGAEKLKAGLMAVTDWLGITDSEADEMAAKREREAEVQKQLQEAEQKRAERLHNSKMSDLDNEIALARAQGKDTTQLQKKKINEEIKIKKAKLATLMVEQQKLEAMKAQLTAMAAQTGVVGAAGKLGLKMLAEREEKTAALQNEIKKLETDLKIVDIEFKKNRKSKRKAVSQDKKDDKKAAEDKQKEIQKQIELEDKQFKLLQSLRENDRQKEITALVEKYETDFKLAEGNAELTKALTEQQKIDIAAINKKYDDEEAAKLKEDQDKVKAQNELLRSLTATDKENELFALQEEFNGKFEMAKGNAELLAALEQQLADKKAAINKKYNDEDKAKAKALTMAKVQMGIDALRLTADIAELFAGKSKKAAKIAFNVKKAADLAEATMSGYKAVISTYANAPGGPILKGLAAGLAGGFAALQIGKIASSKFEGGDKGGDVANVTAPDAGGGQELAAPSFNVVGDTGINQLAELTQGGQNAQPLQAFVVSSNVTTAQSLDRNRIETATI